MRGTAVWFWAVLFFPLATAAQEAPKPPEAPKLPDAPKVPEAPKLPELPKLPDAPQAEKAPGSDLDIFGPGQNEDVTFVEAQEEPLTITEITEQKVSTPSARPETVLTAPAWTLILTEQDLATRGYLELSEVFDDLPGMDVVRARGDDNYKAYWRGYRYSIGAPFLLLLDGLVLNHLWRNETQIISAIPISAIERIEVVYGPGSALYGPNAAMGIVNIVTKRRGQNQDKSGGASAYFRGRTALMTPQSSLKFPDMTKMVDASGWLVWGDLELRISARLMDGVVEPALNQRFEWLNDRYSKDPELWGDFLNYPQVAGAFRSPTDHRSVEARLNFRNLEAGFYLYRMETGYGMAYAADRIQSRGPYVQLEGGVHMRYTQQWSARFSSVSVVRYRRSDIAPPTADLVRITSSSSISPPLPNDGLATFGYQASLNHAWMVSHDFNYRLGPRVFLSEDNLWLSAGFRYENRDLEREYQGVSGLPQDPRLPWAGTSSSGAFPNPLSFAERIENRSNLDYVGLYALLAYDLNPNHHFVFGARLDYNSFLKELRPLFRGGYVGQFFDILTFKLLYGQALQEPNWRSLFGQWDGSGANPGLRSERSSTFEASLAAILFEIAQIQLNGWVVQYADSIVLDDTAQNLRSRITSGLDLSANVNIPLKGWRRLSVWAYYSPYLYAKQARDQEPAQPIGDLATHKIWAGVTAEPNAFLGATALGRCMSERTPVSTNPTGPIPFYCVVDANLTLRSPARQAWSLSFKVNNILGTAYDHPGLRAAASGDRPGQWIDGRWIGSGGFYNSRLPQPGRSFTLSFGMDL